MDTAIYYFSGTGNSLHAARELQKRLPGSDLVPVVRSLRNGAAGVDAETVGFVFPSFCTTVPIPLHDFLQRVDLSAARYVFALCTRGGSPSDAFEYMNELLRRQRKALDACISINMPWNLPLGPEALVGSETGERLQHLEAEMQRKLDLFSRHILAHEAYAEPDTDADYRLTPFIKTMVGLIPRSLNYGLHRYMYQDLVRFYSDSKCIACGTCERVCLSDKVRIVDGRPVWADEVRCYACFACVNFCPRQAVQVQSRFPIKSYTTVHGRYHHPSVSYSDIAEQQ